MIRAKGSVLVYLALAFVIVLLGAALQPLLWFCALIVCTAVGITLFSASAPGLRLSGVCLLALALGILLGYMRIPLEFRHQYTRRSSLVGLPYRELSGFQGYLLEDSNSSTSGARTYRIRLREIWSVERERRIRLAEGPRLSVSLVVQQGGQNYFLGQGIEVEANLRISEKPGRDHFISGRIPGVFNYFSFSYHFSSFQKGLIDTRDLAFYLLVISTFLYLNIKTLVFSKCS